MKRKITFLIAALCAVILMTPPTVSWGQTRTDILTLDCATPAPTGSTTTELSTTSEVATFLNSAAGLSGKITCSGLSGKVYKGKGSGGGSIPQQCLKVGTASGSGSFTFTIPNTYDEVGSIDITCYGWKTTSSISVNSGSAQTFTTAQVEATKTFELASATRTITIAVTTSAVCITEIVLKSAATGEATTVTIDASGITNTDVASGTDAGSLSAVVKDASSNTIAAAAVTWSSSKPSVATINSTNGEVTLIKKGSTTITASYSGVEGTYQPSSNTYVLNVTNSDANDGTSDHPFTVTEARDALDAGEINPETDYYVRGIIAKIGTFNDGTGQLTYWISDDGSMTNNVQCYRGKNVDGEAFAAATDLEVGDIATVKGKLTIYSGTTYEFTENNEVVSITTRTKVNIATFTATTNPLILGITESTATSVTNDQPGWTPVSYRYESDAEGVATVNASGVVSAVAKGTANITVTPVVSATNSTYKVGESKSIEITVSNPSHTAYFSVNGVIDPANNDLVEEGEEITFPSDPSDIGGKAFVGWVASQINGTTDEAPSFVSSSTMSTNDITYYAVFASSSSTTGWRKLAASEVSEAGTYALLTTDGHAFNGSISSGHGQVTTDAFSFTNNVATSAPTETCEITLQAVTGGYKMYNADRGYLYASAASSGKLAWHNSEDSYWLYKNSNWTYNSNTAYLRDYSNNSLRTYGANNGQGPVGFAKKTTISIHTAYCTFFIPVDGGSHEMTEDITIPADVTYSVTSTLVIPNTQTLTVNGILNVTGTLTNNGTAANLIIEDGGQLICSNSVPATFKKTMTAPLKDVYGWELISSPVHDGIGTTIDVANVTNLVSDADPSFKYDMFAYDEEYHMWRTQKHEGGATGFTTLNNGEGYMYRNSGNELSFVGNTNSDDVAVVRDLTYTIGDLAGFHLVGNPYTHSITVNDNVSLLDDGGVALAAGKQLSGYYLLTNGGSEWTSKLGTTTGIATKQGFLIQIPSEAKKIQFSTGAKKDRANADNIMFTVSNSQFKDVAYALFDDALGLNKINHRDADAPMLFINQNGQDYAIAAMSDDTKSFNLNFKAGTIGQYTLSYKADGKFEYLHVIDLLTGEDIDMLLEGEYSFIGHPKDNENRFIVRLAYASDNNDTGNDIFAYQSGSEIYVTGNGELQIFDVTGRRVMNTTINGMESINIPAQGVYIFKLNEKVQKIVVR